MGFHFVDTESMDVLACGEHFRAARCLWDPSGRYVCTVVDKLGIGENFKSISDPGFYLWSFQGKLLQKVGVDFFHMMEWRPRPDLTADLAAAGIKSINAAVKK